MNQEVKDILNLRKKLFVLEYAKAIGNAAGHHVQVDVKFITINDTKGNRVQRYQYTAVDDATRIRALKIYANHNQLNAIEFINHVVNKFPFRIHTIRTDRGHEFQARFHCHVEDKGRDIYISGHVHHNLMGKLNVHIILIRRNFIS
jgi:transposase-like protein